MEGHPPLRILTVCTANVCRSPMAASILQSRLGDRAVVSSAGIESYRLDVPAHADTALAELGIRRVGRHVARLVDAAVLDADGADLVLAMAREHQRAVVLSNPAAWDRTFLLVELVRLADHAGGWRQPGEDVASWLARLSAARDRAAVFATDDRDDISDPYGGPLTTFRATARRLDELASRLVASGRLHDP